MAAKLDVPHTPTLITDYLQVVLRLAGLTPSQLNLLLSRLVNNDAVIMTAITGGDTASEETTSLKRLLEVSTIVLQQAVDLVDNSLTSDDQLTIHSQYMPGSTIGTCSSSSSLTVS